MDNKTLQYSTLHLSEAELEQNIYRIMPEEYVIGLFQKNENVLSQMRNWKDKFENFQLKIGGILNGKPFEYGFQDDFVGQCWTRESLSEAMWGIYASDPNRRYIRIRSTPRKILNALILEHSKMPQDTCFVGKVLYKREAELKAEFTNGGRLDVRAANFANILLLKRRAFKHEKEVRLLFFGDSTDYCAKGLYRYKIDPHLMIDQLMADPNRNRVHWNTDKENLKKATGFAGDIKRSKIYDPPDWTTPEFSD